MFCMCACVCARSSGAFPAEALHTMDLICRSAEAATNYAVIHSYIRDFR